MPGIEKIQVGNQRSSIATTKEKVAVFTLLLIIAIQMITNKLDMITPASFLSNAANISLDGFNYAGIYFVETSRVIAEYISIKDLAFAFYDLFAPIGIILMSPYNIVNGILDAVMENVNQSMISIGTTLSLALLFAVISQRNLWTKLTPIAIIDKLYKYTKLLYTFVGEYLVAISAFYKVLMLDKFVEDAIEIFRTLGNFATVPFETLKTYLKQISLRDSKTRGVLFAGTLTLAGISLYGFYLRNL